MKPVDTRKAAPAPKPIVVTRRKEAVAFTRFVWHRYKATIVFLLMVGLFLTISIQERDQREEADRQSIADRRALHTEVLARQTYEYQNCLRAHVNTQKINATTRAQIRFLSQLEAKSPDRTTLRNYIQIYKDALLIVPTCGPRPK